MPLSTQRNRLTCCHQKHRQWRSDEPHIQVKEEKEEEVRSSSESKATRPKRLPPDPQLGSVCCSSAFRSGWYIWRLTMCSSSADDLPRSDSARSTGVHDSSTFFFALTQALCIVSVSLASWALA